MTMSGLGMATKIAADFATAGFVGVSIPAFTAAYGTGSIENHMVGKGFTTTDAGTVSGTGSGTGTGITGVPAGPLSTAIFAALVLAFGSSGVDLPTITDALSDALAAQLALTSLSSSHSPVYIGTGIVDVGSIAVDAGAWGTAIESLGITSGLLGDDWPDFATEAASEMASAIIAGGTGSVTISGSGDNSGSSVGVGSGTIS